MAGERVNEGVAGMAVVGGVDEGGTADRTLIEGDPVTTATLDEGGMTAAAEVAMTGCDPASTRDAR